MDYEEELKAALIQDDLKKVQTLAFEVFEHSQEEDLLAWVAGCVFEKQVESCFSLIPQFVDRFPGSLHPIRTYLAALLLNDGRFDGASNEARIHLRTMKNAGLFQKEDQIVSNPLWSEGAGRAFLQLSSVYTEAGARSYSKRVLEWGRPFVSDYWRQIYDKELATLDQEFKNKEIREQDEEWEAFFSSGDGAAELVKKCEEKGFQALRMRVVSIESQFRYFRDYKVTEEEIFQVIMEDEKKGYGLA